VYAQPSHSGREFRIARGDNACITRRAEILARIKTETPGEAERARAPAAVLRADRLCRIFQQDQTLGLAEFQQRIHVGHLTIQVNRQHHFRPRRNHGRNLIDAQVVSERIDIDKNRPGAEARDRTGSRKEAEGSGDDLVTGADIECHQRQQQSVGTGSTTDRVARLAISSDFAFQGGDLGPHDEVLRLENTIDGLAHVVAYRGILRL